ncbi:MAG TPA: phenylacetate--CoA ligase family protein, partial [Pirellulaceae bacterium]|nr:phenylacetate--CoA ligase family protein [Pirellulaceae bacterium]
RTGDIVRPVWDHGEGTCFVKLAGGVLGRVDDMFVVRGVNLFPTSIEAILREFPEVQEFQICLSKRGELDELSIRAEVPESLLPTIQESLSVRLGLRIPLESVAVG